MKGPLVALLLALFVSGCDLIGDIFEFGLWVGIILVALLAGGAYLLFKAVRR